MLPKDTTVRQLKKLRAETKGTDIGDLTSGDRLNHNVPNLQYIGNPVDNKVESWEDFSKHDSQLQTIAFKSKLVNKPLVKENKTKIMKEKINNVLAFNDFEKNWKAEAKKTKRTEVAKDIVKEDVKKYNESGWEDFVDDDLILDDDDLDIDDLDDIDDYSYDKEYNDGIGNGVDADDLDDDDFDDDDFDDDDFDDDDLDDDDLDDDDLNDLDDDLDLEENVQTFEAFTLKDAPKEEKQPEYTILGKEKEPKSNPNFGIAAVKDLDNKKIAFFNNFVIDPPTPKERPILNAGQYIDNEFAKGQINRIEGNKVFIESADEPMKIIEINIKDAVKVKKS